MNEQERAVEYRRQATARVRDRERRERALKGDRAAAAQVEREWAPLRRWDGWNAEQTITEDVR